MKAINFRLLATMITLAAVTMTGHPADAQRRTTETRTKVSREEPSGKTRKSTILNSDKNNYETRPRSSNQKEQLKSFDIKRNREQSATRSPQKESVNRENTSKNNPARLREERQTRSRSTLTESPQAQKNETRERSRISGADRGRELSGNQISGNSRTGNDSEYLRGETRERSAREPGFNKIDESDRRYHPGNNYRGSRENWNGNFRPSSMNYNRTDRNFYRNYNYNSYHHWDRRWENYRWNVNSWRDYYWGYNPYSFAYSKYYYHHHRYGHVLRKFVYPPVVFYHHHQRYYCYDGHFFRYKRGIGYVLVEMPFGFTFDFLPGNYELVYINGYPYYRVGNLFFENNGYGFSLIHYPERYISVRFDLAFNF